MRIKTDQIERNMYKHFWTLMNPESRKRSIRKYYQNNKAKVHARSRAWEKRTGYQEKYRVTHRLHLNTIKRNWEIRNPDKVTASRKVQKLKRRKVAIFNPKAIEKIYTRARELRQWFDVVVDHILPISKGGSHSPENLQIIYAYENKRKYNSLTYKPRVIFI